MRGNKLFKMIMTIALSMALIFSMSPEPAFAGDTGEIGIVDSFDGETQRDIYFDTVAAVPSAPADEAIVSPFLLSKESKPRFAEDRVIIKMAVSGNNLPADSDNPQISFEGSILTRGPQNAYLPPDMGVAFTDIRVLNPSITFDTNTRYNVFVLTLEETGSEAVQNALAILNANPAVEIAEPDFLYKLDAVPNDPMFNAQYALEKINAEQAWNVTTGSKSVVVGVVDTGIDGIHPDLAANLWVNPDPDQNGYVNDIHGYNFTGRIGGIPTDENGHGTHVAGIIGAKGNNGIGPSGINWDVSLAWMGIGVGDNVVSVSAAIEAINYANNHNITILNNSYGGSGYSEIFREAIAGYKGLFVASAGNNYRQNNDIWPQYPASYDLPNIISVASTDESDNLSDFSNYGDNSVHIAAPGSGILSTYLNGAYEVMSGTSMACSYVAGVAALIKAVNPDYPPELIREVLLASTKPVASNEFRPSHDFGVVDARAAVLFDIGDLYTVTYNFLDDKTAPVVVKTAPGNRLREPAEPERAGYGFDGWYTEAYGGVPYNFSYAVNGDITLYARWFVPEPGMYYVEFPDLNFQREVLRLLNEHDYGHRTTSGVISASDKTLLASLASLDVRGGNIHDITGLKYFTGLTKLDCSRNQLTKLDISRNVELTGLDFSDNELTELNVTDNVMLTELYGNYNRMVSLDDVIGWREIGLILDDNFTFYPQKAAFADIQSRIAAYGTATEDVIITIGTDIPVLSSLTIPGNPNGKTLTITSDNGTRALTRRFRTPSGSNVVLAVNAGASVILKNIIIDGNKDSYADVQGPLVYVNGGDLIVEDGAVLTNNNGNGLYIWDGTFTMTGGEISENIADFGAGVYIYNGVFTMTGGKITGHFSRWSGGSVYMAAAGTFAMTGGEISGNYIRGVYMYGGAFTMTGGKIADNTLGGVIIANNAAFTMTGGEISGNTGYDGVFVSGAGAFTMTGGVITGNAGNCGGVYVSRGITSGKVLDSGTLTLGGTAVVRGNTNGNVCLSRGLFFGGGFLDDAYIMLGTGLDGNGVIAPLPGMEIGIRTEATDGVIVRSGARPGDETYFVADGSGNKVTYEGDRLFIAYGYGICILGHCMDKPSDLTIMLNQDLTLTDILTIPSRATITIKSADAANPVTLTRGIDGNLFTVMSGTRLILEDIVIDGNKDAYPDDAGSLVYVDGGEFTMKDGVVLTNNGNDDSCVSIFVGTFTMLGGKISGNNGYGGSGVFVSGAGAFIMAGGEISGNTALIGGGVYIAARHGFDGSLIGGKFIMLGGKISGNSADYGGGAYSEYGAEFTMTGGKISGNSADCGGGVMVESDEIIFGGTAVIKGNTSSNVYLSGDRYITLSKEIPPASGMEIWVMKDDDGAIVHSGANPDDAAYFFADEAGKKVVRKSGQLIIVNADQDVPRIIYGDVDGNGYVEMPDALMLARWLANWTDIHIDAEAADVDTDGDVTLLDLLVLLRHLTGWTEYATLPWRQ